jgi:hypothetical protein
MAQANQPVAPAQPVEEKPVEVKTIATSKKNKNKA